VLHNAGRRGPGPDGTVQLSAGRKCHCCAYMGCSEAEIPVAGTPVAEPVVDTAVLANVSPETVAAVIGHDEKKPSDKVQIGQKMPSYLL